MRWRPGGRHGAKFPSCLLVLSGNYARSMFEIHNRPDSIFRTWIHESLHARQPFTAEEFLAEADEFKGYEEGLVEGLARIVVREKAAMETVDLAYDRYVRAYRTLAGILGTPPEHLWRELWAAGNGHVRAAFPAAIAGQLRSTRGQPLTAGAAAEMHQAADLLFATGRENEDLTDSQMERIWRSVL